MRGQGTYLSDDEINAVVDVVSTGEQNFVNELVNMKVDKPEDGAGPAQIRKRDELYESAIDVVVREGRGSVSLLQRTLGIGYGRAARLIDFMAEDGIVGEYNGSQAREVTRLHGRLGTDAGVESEPEPPPEAKPDGPTSCCRIPNGDDADRGTAATGPASRKQKIVEDSAHAPRPTMRRRMTMTRDE